MVNECLINCIQLCFIFVCLLLTICEVFSAFIILGIEIYQLDQVLTIPFFKKNQNDLYVSSFLFLVASFVLCWAFILQWTIKNSKTVNLYRNFANLLFTAAAIYHLFVMKKKNEANIIQNVIKNWETAKYGSEYEDKHDCIGVLGCLPEMKKSFQNVFENGRGIKALIGLFWCSIIFYGLISMGCVLIAKNTFNV